jgi:ornithine carbamoyltransferase
VNKDFLSIAGLTRDEISGFFELAADLKKKQKSGELVHPLRGKTLGMVFLKPSTRTRISFEVGMLHLGGHALYLSPAEIGLGSRESVPDVARVLSRYVDGIMARLFGHEDIVQLAKWASVPVINGLTDLLHPCQILGDMLTIIEHKGTYEGVHVAYAGDGNNVCNSWLNLASRIPFKFTMAVPEGYEPNREIVQDAKAAGLSEIEIFRSPEEAVKGADIIYTDVWASMGQETEAETREKIFDSYRVNDALFSHAKPDALFMHCLPAHRGEEVTDSIMDGAHSIVFDQAENRLHIQKAIMLELMGKQ